MALPLVTRRGFLVATAAGALMPVVSHAAAAETPPLIREDYAEARQQFRTKLLRKGPSPDELQPLSAPPGARRLDYRSGQLTLTAWISENANVAPTGSTRLRPAVLFLHGGNSLWQGHWDLARPFVEAGYVAMIPAVRAENGLPGSFSGFYDETEDVLAAADRLLAQPCVDPARFYIAGHSVGGTLTLLAAMASSKFRAAAAFSGNPDARAFFHRYPEDVRFDASAPREFDMRSAACFAESFKCPVLMLHGTKERGAEDAVRLTAKRAKAAGLSVHHAIVDGDHSSAIPGESAEALKFFAGV